SYSMNCYVFYCTDTHTSLLSFPTRRSSDLLLLGHPVHVGRALVDLADLVRRARVEEHPLGERGLSRVDVGRDPDVPHPREFEWRSEEHTSELQSRENLVCRLLLEKKK